MTFGSLKENIRRKCLQLLRLFKLYNNFSLVPKGIIDVDRLRPEANMLYYKAYEPVRTAEPLNVDASIHPKFRSLLTYTPQATFTIEENNWRVWGNQGAVITDSNYLFKEVSREFDDQTHSIFNQVKLTAAEKVAGTSAVLAASGGDVYYHWMFDILPRIDILKRSGGFDKTDQFIINYTRKSFQKQTLEKAGVVVSKVLVSDNLWNFHVRAENLMVPSLPSKNDIPSFEACQYLRSLYADEITGKTSTRKLYIRRSDGRHILNEADLMEILDVLDFETVYPEKLSVAQQAGLFAEAEIVVGAHGAGFTNIVFCNPGTLVLDIFSPRWVNPCYWIVANHLDLKYAYLIGESIQEDKKTTDKGSNIRIDVAKFSKVIDKLYA